MGPSIVQQGANGGSGNSGSVDETRPLLGDRSGDDDTTDGARHRRSLRRRLVVVILFAVIIGLDSSLFILSLPLTRVYESIACYWYYEAREPSRFLNPGSIPESLCKVQDVQAELAIVRGYERLFQGLPGVFLALPYGSIADRWGRKPVFFLCAVGIAGSMTMMLLVCRFWWIFPLRFVWIAWLLTVIGGGAPVMTSTAYSMLTDVTVEGERSRMFLYAGVAALTSQAVSLPIASMLMDKYGTSVPISLGYVIGLLTCLLILALPETLSKDRIAVETDSETDEMDVSASNGWLSRSLKVVIGKMTEAVDSFGFLLKSPPLMGMVLSFLMNTLGSSSIDNVIQYISKRFSIPIASAGYLLTVRAIVTVTVFLFVIKLLARLLTYRYGLRGPPRDLWLARITVLFFPLGFLLISIGGNTAIVAVGMSFTAFGLGSGSLMRSVATALVHGDQVARLHAAMCLVDNVGSLVSGPLLAETYALGLRLGGAWIALPFVGATVLTTFGSWITWLVRLPESSDVED